MRLTLLPLLVAVVYSIPFAIAEPSPRESDDLFTKNILPLLKTKCFACHGDDAKKIKGNLDLRSRESMLKGGESKSPTLTPNDPAKSLLYLAVTRDGTTPPMPPKEN